MAGLQDADHIESGETDPINDSAPFPVRHYTPCKVDIRVKDGDVLHAAGLTVTCIHTPGHTDGSMFYQVTVAGKTVLLVGDLLSIAPDLAGVTTGWEGGVEHDRRRYLQSLMRIEALPVDAILPGHFQPGLSHTDALLRSALKAAIETWRRPMLQE